MKFVKVAALFLLSILTREAVAGEIKPYSQAEFNALAAEGGRYCSISAQTGALRAQRKRP